MQECFIIRRGGTDASTTELSEHLKGTIQIAGNVNPMIPIAGDVTPIEVPFDTPDPLLNSISLENLNQDGTAFLTYNNTNTPVTLYCKDNIEESQYTELVVPNYGETFEITINNVTYTTDSSNNPLTENGSKVFFLQRDNNSQGYFFYKTNLTNYCVTTSNSYHGIFAYSDEDFVKEEAGTVLYNWPWYYLTATKTNNGKAIVFLANVLDPAERTRCNPCLFLIGKTQNDVMVTGLSNAITWTWQQNEKTYYMNFYYINATTYDPYTSYGGTTYVPFLGCQKPITLAQDVYCLSNGFNFELINRFGYLLENTQQQGE